MGIFVWVSLVAQLGGASLAVLGAPGSFSVVGGLVWFLGFFGVVAHLRRRAEAPAGTANGGDTSEGPKAAATSGGEGTSDEESLPERPSEVLSVAPSEDSAMALAVLEAVLRDRAGFFAFFHETRCRMADLQPGPLAPEGARQTLLTLSANADLFQLSSLAALARDAIESHTPSHLDLLREHFQALEALLSRMDATDLEEHVEIQFSEFEALTDLAQSSSDSRAVVERLERLRQEPTRQGFRRLRRYAELVARRSGADAPNIVILDDGVHLSRERFSALWATLLHLVENAIVHGLESPDERAAQGKPRAGQITLRSKIENAKIWLEVSDDGRGIDWNSVGEKARQARLRAATRDDLVLALWSGNVGSRQGGHAGIGLSAVASACRELHGEVALISTPGRGTTVRFSMPLRSNLAVFVPSLSPRVAESLGLRTELVFGSGKAAS